MKANPNSPFFLTLKVIALFMAGLYLLAYPIWVMPYFMSVGKGDFLMPSEMIVTGALSTVYFVWSFKSIPELWRVLNAKAH